MIRPFSLISVNELPAAGGKGGTLARLSQAGFPVPPGFVLFPHAFAGDDPTPAAWAQALDAVEKLRAGSSEAAFAVRSSALCEDSAQASFAGEFETALDVRSVDGVRDAIRSVRRSRHGIRVEAYGQAMGIDQSREMAVVVQRMVVPRISGVLFTADPVSGSRRRMVGNYVHGLGDSLVSGAATGEAFTLARPGGAYQGPSDLARHARTLFRLALRLERLLGGPQDIEWAIGEDGIALLQARPITTLLACDSATGMWNDSRSRDALWANVNFGEAIPDVMTPLTWSVVRHSLADWCFIPGEPTVGNIGGRPYLNISVFASIFEAVGRSRQDLLDTLEATLHMPLPADLRIPTVPLSRRETLGSLVRGARIFARQGIGVLRTRAYLASNPAWFARIRQRLAEARHPADLLALWREEIAPHLLHGVWCVLGTAGVSADFALRLRRDLARLVGPMDADALIANLGGLEAGLASLAPLLGLAAIARGEGSRAAYIEEHGHRGPGEFELSVPRPAEDPAWLDRELDRLRASPVDLEAVLARQRLRHEEAWNHLRTIAPGQAKSLGRRIARHARLSRQRENARSAYVRDRWAVRIWAVRAGELTGIGEDVFFLELAEVLALLAGSNAPLRRIAARRETYRRNRALPAYPPVIRGRFDPVRWAADPARRTDIFDAEAAPASPAAGGRASAHLSGAPGSAGVVEGIVRVLATPDEGHDLQEGEILVAVQTDIAWTLVFPRAAGIVTDVGAPLSHAAIVARELGIPAVVGCGDATMRLATGDRVRLDGGRGTVEILVAAGAEDGVAGGTDDPSRGDEAPDGARPGKGPGAHLPADLGRTTADGAPIPSTIRTDLSYP